MSNAQGNEVPVSELELTTDGKDLWALAAEVLLPVFTIHAGPINHLQELAIRMRQVYLSIKLSLRVWYFRVHSPIVTAILGVITFCHVPGKVLITFRAISLGVRFGCGACAWGGLSS